jgi:hypothetical protein
MGIKRIDVGSDGRWMQSNSLSAIMIMVCFVLWDYLVYTAPIPWTLFWSLLKVWTDPLNFLNNNKMTIPWTIKKRGLIPWTFLRRKTIPWISSKKVTDPLNFLTKKDDPLNIIKKVADPLNFLTKKDDPLNIKNWVIDPLNFILIPVESLDWMIPWTFSTTTKGRSLQPSKKGGWSLELS